MRPADVEALVEACASSYAGDARQLLEDAALGQRYRDEQARKARVPRLESPAFVAKVLELHARGYSQRRIAKWITPEYGDATLADPYEALRARVRRCLEKKRDGSRAVSHCDATTRAL